MMGENNGVELLGNMGPSLRRVLRGCCVVPGLGANSGLDRSGLGLQS